MSTLPLIHLGGTSPRELREQHEAVVAATNALIMALRDAEPHLRDYYPLPSGTAVVFPEAQKRQQVKLLALEIVRDEAMAVVRACRDHEGR